MYLAIGYEVYRKKEVDKPFESLQTENVIRSTAINLFILRRFVSCILQNTFITNINL